MQNYLSSTTDPLTENITSSSAYYAAGDYDSTNTTLVSSVVVGKLKSTTAPDPDGAGSQTAEVTKYDYSNTTRLLTKITHADATTELFVYGTSGGSLNLVTEYTDRLGKVVKFMTPTETRFASSASSALPTRSTWSMILTIWPPTMP